MHHIQEVIRLEGGNEYMEGKDTRCFKGFHIKGVLSKRALYEVIDKANITESGNANSFNLESEWVDVG